ncbi:hypothetical protein KP509_01G097800 [Ceratopteris richardii]|uniref:5'-3' exonuclease domain-containing protein n=1 Tax=Ceratopteris richardii TaxID=49495 RepID=A0A8T2VIS6_CERRI|nr:hypothetical protein KP509_01G097800 [Ceratopteris richardii]
MIASSAYALFPFSTLSHPINRPNYSFFSVTYPSSRKPKHQTCFYVHAGPSDVDSSISSTSLTLPPDEPRRSTNKTLFLLDIAPLCYSGKRPSPSALIGWLKPLFLHVTFNNPIIAVIDGERGNEYRRQILPGYKSSRNAFVPLSTSLRRETWKGDDADLREARPFIKTFFKTCGIPVVSLEDAEADDVVASLMEQAVSKGFQVTIGSPDKDFKQLLCENVQLLMPLPERHRWSLYTDKLYIQQQGCSPEIELSLRCLLGDKADCVPGLADFAPGFGRKTALKLLRKYGSLEHLLREASSRTVGKPYIQNALTEYASVLWKNLQVLRLRRSTTSKDISARYSIAFMNWN